MWVFIFLRLLFVSFLILRRTERDTMKYMFWFSYKLPSILVRFSRNLNFLGRFSKNTKIPNYMQILPEGAELFRVGEQRDVTKLIVGFRNLANTPKKN
jgi:hypothetical protein